MYQLKDLMNKIYPLKPYKTEIFVDDLVENSVEAKGTGLLFSGGVDSTYSLFSNWEKKPHLIMIWGIDMHPYPDYAEHWSDLESMYGGFAEKNGLEFSIIKTNASQILNYSRIEHDYHTETHNGRFRLRHQHSLISIPLVAPFSFNKFDELLFAAGTFPTSDMFRRSSTTIPSVDEKIVWADLVTKHDGFIPRLDKLQALTEFAETQDIFLKVCQKPKLNCCAENKCYKTLMFFALKGIDPKKFGFEVKEHTFDDMRKYYDTAQRKLWNVDDYFAPIQKMIPDNIDHVIEGSRPFFEWFVDKDLYSNVKDNWRYRVIYNLLPYSLASEYDRLLGKLKINIHPTSWDINHFPKIKDTQYDIQ